MKLKHTVILTALAVALNGVFIANAADEKPAKEEKAEKAQPAKKAKRHDHMEQDKQGPARMAEDACCKDPTKSAKKPLHDHRETRK